MKHVSLFWIAAVAIAFVGVTALPVTTRGQDQRPAPAPAFKASISHDDLMYWHDRAFGQAKLAIEKKEWEEAQVHALLLAELSNVNTTQKPEEKYRKFAGELRDSALELANAAKKKDGDAGRKLYEKLDATCTACHDAYEH